MKENLNFTPEVLMSTPNKQPKLHNLVEAKGKQLWDYAPGEKIHIGFLSIINKYRFPIN